MARTPMFASGRHARFVCDGCGFAYAYREAMTEPETGFRKCRRCGVDEPEPRWAPRIAAQALRHPRPDRNELAGLLDLDGTGTPLELGGGQGFLEIGSDD